jgi:hypothetical protein
MPIQIDEMNTEVVAEAPGQLAGAESAPPTEQPEEVARVRFAIAIATRLGQRLAAEGYDD